MTKSQSVDRLNAIAKVVEGPVTEAVPASALRLHRSVIIVADRSVAARLRSKQHCADAAFA